MTHKPTEQEKLDGDTSHEEDGTITVGTVNILVKIKTETTPNQNGGYDTKVKIPRAIPVGAVNETGGN